MSKSIHQMTKSELTSEINALQYKDKWDVEDCRYYDELMYEFYRIVEEEAKSTV